MQRHCADHKLYIKMHGMRATRASLPLRDARSGEAGEVEPLVICPLVCAPILFSV